jgi:ribosomal protein S18 acetylase RimI-like enzyme
MNINYKPAGRNDIPLLLELMSEFYVIEHLPYDSLIITKGMEKFFSSDVYGKCWIINVDKILVGYILLTFGFSFEYHGVDALIDEFYIREEYRGKGIGKQTLEYVEQELTSLGIKAFHLEVDRQNFYAQSLYRKYGFEDHDRYLMTKWISKDI